MTVYDASQGGIAVHANADLSISQYLEAMKVHNPELSEVVLTVESANYEGPGKVDCTFKGEGIALAPQGYELAPWSSRMDSFLVSVH